MSLSSGRSGTVPPGARCRCCGRPPTPPPAAAPTTGPAAGTRSGGFPAWARPAPRPATPRPSAGCGRSPNGSRRSATPSEVPAKGGRYHHGDLKAALVDAAIGLIAERGVRDFSLAEVSRRLGVTVAAPYRHFADRDALLAAVAIRALGVFAEMVTRDAAAKAPPAERLAAMARDYVRFAAEQRPLFDTMFAAGIDKSEHPEVH